MTHASGKDNRPSFGVTVGDARSGFNCYVCRSGTLEELLGVIELYLKAKPQFKDRYHLAKAREILDAQDSAVPVLPDYEVVTPSPAADFQEWPEWWLQQFLPWNALDRSSKYVRERGIRHAVADIFQLRYDQDRDMVLAPIFNVNGRLCGARGRKIGNVGLKHYDYAWNKIRNSHLIWFHEPARKLSGPMVLVEGQFDCMRVFPHHHKVMAILSSKTTVYKMAKLTGEDQVVLMLDNDPTGQQKTQEWAQYLQGKGVEVGVITLPDGVKDAGEASEQWLHETFSTI